MEIEARLRQGIGSDTRLEDEKERKIIFVDPKHFIILLLYSFYRINKVENVLVTLSKSWPFPYLPLPHGYLFANIIIFQVNYVTRGFKMRIRFRNFFFLVVSYLGLYQVCT